MDDLVVAAGVGEVFAPETIAMSLLSGSATHQRSESGLSSP
jgi:hypothetical protein